MGLKEGKIAGLLNPGFSLLCKLSLKLLNPYDDIPLDEVGRKVGSDLLGPYINKIVAPDHLFTGIGKCILEAFFMEINNEETRGKFDIYLCFALREIGIEGKTTLFNQSKGKHKLLSITMSTVYALITMPPTTIIRLNLERRLKVTSLASKLNEIVSLCFW